MVIQTIDNPPKAAFKSIVISIFDNIVNIINKLIVITNLILLGHKPYENKINYDLFMTYQIGIFILEVFGKIIILGLMKYLYEKIEEDNEVYTLYNRMKTSLVFLIPIILFPISILSYYIIEIILKKCLEIYVQSLSKEIYLKFMLFAPVIFLFEILFYLNIHYLCYKEKLKRAFLFSIFIYNMSLCIKFYPIIFIRIWINRFNNFICI